MGIEDIIFGLMCIVIVLNVAQSAQLAALNEMISNCPTCNRFKEKK